MIVFGAVLSNFSQVELGLRLYEPNVWLLCPERGQFDGYGVRIHIIRNMDVGVTTVEEHNLRVIGMNFKCFIQGIEQYIYAVSSTIYTTRLIPCLAPRGSELRGGVPPHDSPPELRV